MLDYRMDTFLTLCELLNYRETAQLLHITQPAVTQHIHYLEQQYGCKLFTYENRKLSKTSEALVLEEYVRAAKYNEASVRQKLQKSSAIDLRIGATKTIGDYVIGDYVKQYLSDADHGLDLIVDNTEHLLRLLEENQLDFAIIEGYFNKTHFASQRFRTEPFVGICHRDHPFCGKEVSIQKLMEETIIQREMGSGTRDILERKLQSYNASLEQFPRKICISSFKLILEMVKSGVGVSFVYQVLADSDPELGSFRFQGEPIVREFDIVYLKHTDPSDKIRLFLGDDF